MRLSSMFERFRGNGPGLRGNVSFTRASRRSIGRNDRSLGCHFRTSTAIASAPRDKRRCRAPSGSGTRLRRRAFRLSPSRPAEQLQGTSSARCHRPPVNWPMPALSGKLRSSGSTTSGRSRARLRPPPNCCRSLRHAVPRNGSCPARCRLQQLCGRPRARRDCRQLGGAQRQGAA